MRDYPIKAVMLCLLINISIILTISNTFANQKLPPNLQKVTCNPPLNIKEEEWGLQPKTWGDGNLIQAKQDPQSIFKQLRTDVIIFYNTLFPSSRRQDLLYKCKAPASEKFPHKELCQGKQFMLEEERENFMKRLFLVLADAPLKYTPVGNDTSQLKPWPYPIASSLAHGLRIVFDFDNIGKGELFYNLLLSGDPGKIPEIDTTRWGASHGFKVDKRWGQIRVQEVSLKGFKYLPKNVMLGMSGKHRGVNITLGGIGNFDKDGLEIAPGGFRYDPKTGNVLSKIQHGHAYIQVENFSKDRAAMMIGIEGSMPCAHCKNMYGDVHTPKEGFTISTDVTSIMGGQKMERLFADRKCEAPAYYGGMWVKVDKAYFNHLQRLYKAVLNRSVDNQKMLFKKLLSSPGLEAQQILRKEFPELYK